MKWDLLMAKATWKILRANADCHKPAEYMLATGEIMMLCSVNWNRLIWTAFRDWFCAEKLAHLEADSQVKNSEGRQWQDDAVSFRVVCCVTSGFGSRVGKPHMWFQSHFRVFSQSLVDCLKSLRWSLVWRWAVGSEIDADASLGRFAMFNSNGIKRYVISELACFLVEINWTRH